jgi:hypothetical protein
VVDWTGAFVLLFLVDDVFKTKEEASVSSLSLSLFSLLSFFNQWKGQKLWRT